MHPPPWRKSLLGIDLQSRTALYFVGATAGEVSLLLRTDDSEPQPNRLIGFEC